MPVALSKAVAANTDVDASNTRQLKTLNRLGYYRPLAVTGITDIPDRALIDALWAFQNDHNLSPTGVIKPGDDTERRLNHTAHETPAALDGVKRAWSDTPDPGEDYNCRCWAEPVPEIKIPQNASKELKDAFEDVKNNLEDFDEIGASLAARLLRHYIGNTGTPIVLSPEAMNGINIVQSAIKINRQRFEDSIVKTQIFNLKEGQQITLKDYWDFDHGKISPSYFIDRDFFYAIGSVKIRSRGVIEAKRHDNRITVKLCVTHGFRETYDFDGGISNLSNETVFGSERLLVKKDLAKIFWVSWIKEETGQGVINLDGNGNIQNFVFGWPENSL